jgi:hypothetical protein
MLKKRPSPDQCRIAEMFGLSIENDIPEVGYQRILDKLAILFGRPVDDAPVTQAQIDYALMYGFDISHETKRIASVFLGALASELDDQSIERQNLQPDDTVVLKSLKPDVQYCDHREFKISSIINGMVYFKGGNGQRAAARNVVKIHSER